MTGEHFETMLQESPRRDVKLNEVFNKLTDMFHQQGSVTPAKPKISCCIETVPQGLLNSGPDLDSSTVEALSRRLEAELRAAKSAQLSCGEVLLPAELLPRIASDVLRLAENEPCGLRGCTLFIDFLESTGNAEELRRRIGTVKCDPHTVSTFELFLTLKQDPRSTWHSILPQFIKNLTKGGTIMISPGFTLEKKKLYRSYLE